MSEYIIGVDAGGTKTNARLYDRDGNELFSAYSGFGNMLVERGEALGNIQRAITDCINRIPEGSGVFVLVGAAGVSTGSNKADMLAFLRGSFPACEVVIETDGCLALYAAFCGEDGVLVISGTGSIAYGKLGKDIYRAGGWGHILGDEGSGYHIAVAALRQILREYDGNTGYSGLSALLLKHLDTDAFGIVEFVHSRKKAEIASLAKIVEEAAADGDSFAISLLENAGRMLAGLAGTVYRKAGFNGCVPIAASGGVLEKTPMVRDSFAASLDRSRFTLLNKSRPAAIGAYYYSKLT